MFSHGREMIQSRLLETHPTNPNGEDQTTIITNPANGLVSIWEPATPAPTNTRHDISIANSRR